MAPAPPVDNSPILVKLLTAGVSGCVADLITFPLDTAKVRLQVNIICDLIYYLVNGIDYQKLYL